MLDLIQNGRLSAIFDFIMRDIWKTVQDGHEKMCYLKKAYYAPEKFPQTWVDRFKIPGLSLVYDKAANPTWCTGEIGRFWPDSDTVTSNWFPFLMSSSCLLEK